MKVKYSKSKRGRIKKSHGKPIWSLKAAIRKIRKWNVPKGTKFKVCLPWIGHEMIVTKK